MSRLEYARLLAAKRAGRASITQVQMTALLVQHRGVSLATNAYGRWESGKRKPDEEWAKTIAAVSGTDAGWLLLGNASRAPEPEGYAEWLAAKSGTSQFQSGVPIPLNEAGIAPPEGGKEVIVEEPRLKHAGKAKRRRSGGGG